MFGLGNTALQSYTSKSYHVRMRALFIINLLHGDYDCSPCIVKTVLYSFTWECLWIYLVSMCHVVIIKVLFIHVCNGEINNTVCQWVCCYKYLACFLLTLGRAYSMNYSGNVEEHVLRNTQET